MFDSGRSYFLGRSHIRLAPIDIFLLKSKYLEVFKNL